MHYLTKPFDIDNINKCKLFMIVMSS